MAILRIQENIKKADGDYDVVHKETEAGLVMFDDGESLEDKFGIVNEISVVLSANSWTDNSQTISVSGISKNSCGSVAPAQNITAEQMSALCDAMLHVTGQSDGAITVTAFQEVPTVDIPIVVTISGRVSMV